MLKSSYADFNFGLHFLHAKGEAMTMDQKQKSADTKVKRFHLAPLLNLRTLDQMVLQRKQNQEKEAIQELKRAKLRLQRFAAPITKVKEQKQTVKPAFQAAQLYAEEYR